jgi:superfamily II DNA or RNA helicase
MDINNYTTMSGTDASSCAKGADNASGSALAQSGVNGVSPSGSANASNASNTSPNVSGLTGCPRTYIGEKGYTIIKEYIDEKEQKWIRENLTPRPYIPGSPIQPPSFKVYQESQKKLYIPRCFGYKHYGQPDEIRIKKGDPINLSFKGDLRDYQKNIVKTYMDSKIDGAETNNNEKSPVGLLEIPCGRGKCLGKDTPILMYDMSIKKVQHVKVGDLLMGDDSAPRKVQSLARGRETMYKIYTDTGHYIVNESHILSLKTKDNMVVDISLLDYISNKHSYKKLYGYRVGVNRDDRVGVNRDDRVGVNRDDRVGVNASISANENANANNEEIQTQISPQRAYSHGWNRSSFDRALTAHHLSCKEEYKVIKQEFLNTDRMTRIHLLAGIMDYNIKVHHNKENIFKDIIGDCRENYYNIINLSNQFAEDILFLVRSLGWGGIKYKTYAPKLTENTIIDEIESLYMVELYFPSENDLLSIPLKYDANAVAQDGKQRIRSDLLLYNISVERLDEYDYYGFEIDGNRRFILGDYTVTHNTVIALNIISQLKTKTLVVVHKGFLLNQWVERIEQFLPGARIGKIQGQIIDIDKKDIVIGMIQSLSMKEYPQDMFSSFGLTIVDECHHISSEVFSKTLQKIVTRCMLGLSATMDRKDGLTPVFKMFLGNIVYSEKREEEYPVLVKGIQFNSANDEVYDETIYDYRGNPAFSSMITKLCNYSHRTEFILKVLKRELEIKPDQQIMILAHNRNLLTYLYQAIEKRALATVGYYVGGMKEADLKKSETKKVIVATYSMAAEGLDIKTLSTLILATPKTDVVQAVGRILRVKHERPLIIDIVDSHDMFKNQWNKRRAFYLKCKYRVIYTDNEGYFVDKWRDSECKKNKKTKTKQTELSIFKKVAKCDGLINAEDCESEDDEECEEEDYSEPETKPKKVSKCLITFDE